MRSIRLVRSSFRFAALLVLGCLGARANTETNSPAVCPLVVVAPDRADGIYAIDQPVTWRVEVSGATANILEGDYFVKLGGLTKLVEGKIALTNGVTVISAKLSEPGTLLLQIKVPLPDGKRTNFLGGAVVAPDEIKPSSPRPADFDAFWQAKLDELSQVPPNPKLVSQETDRPGTEYWQVTLDNIHGAHIRGQLARPTNSAKLPAMLIVQGAGVYGLPKQAVTHPASKGWLALNLNAHDLPLDEKPEFYLRLFEGELKDYWNIGNEDREKSYFLRMFLGCYRAAEYLTQRPDWDGKTFLVTGVSQGGLQALITAGLHPKVTAAIAGVPGGCDLTGAKVGRNSGWPARYWKKGQDTEAAFNTSRYFDAVNFASRIRCPVLVSAGLIDEVCAPAGIFVAANQITSPKEIVLLPLADHMGGNDSHRAFKERSSMWQRALGQGEPAPVGEVVVNPKAYNGALRNPLMGFIGPLNGKHEYATLAREYVTWNSIETNATDTVEKLRAYADAHWRGVETRNIKVIPRVFLEWPAAEARTNTSDPYTPFKSYFPPDLTPRDYTSDTFKQRVTRMIAKMGEAWDNDPRIAFIEMGMIGPWGEQHHPSPTPEMQKVLGDAFKAAFKHKPVMNRYPWEFQDYEFGIHWDSFGNPGWEMLKHVPELEGRLAERWKIAPMGGEMAFDTSPNPKPRLALNPTEAVATQADTLIRYIRRWHWSALGWVSLYDAKDEAAAKGAARIQSAFGYRLVIDEARYPVRAEAGEKISVSFAVRNLGSAPMYFNWPVEISLLDAKTREPVWKSTFAGIDIRQWLPGDYSDKGKGRRTGDKTHAAFEWDTGLDYDIAPGTNRVSGTFTLPKSLPAGEYLVALAILDPAGNLPSARFAIANYFNGGRHPLGKIGIGISGVAPQLEKSAFDDPAKDRSLRYVVAPR